eukprot:CAMPEP_0185256398 /NCGR_PEP_ID=MMETSP1359-20130426/5512_1 /TAXON_ID=552665 /ORGANISM="Bigelowiella longifila, Strain CCMP242" /LENGTH=40 /DNA_ID= /DNA_START= /DNA_END= /DNA_ORIENTATION=
MALPSPVSCLFLACDAILAASRRADDDGDVKESLGDDMIE